MLTTTTCDDCHCVIGPLELRPALDAGRQRCGNCQEDHERMATYRRLRGR